MQALDSDLWITETPLRFLGLEVGARMTLVRLPDGRLWLHSPIEASPDLIEEVSALGSVAYLVAPNRFHHRFVDGWQRAYPNAETYLAPGLETKRADLDATGVLTDEAESGWREALEQVAVQGLPFANEIAFFHRPTRTLLLTDLAFNVGAHAPAFTRLFFRLGGTLGQLSPTLLERVMVRDRVALRTSLERILAWPFERVIVSHGDICEQGGREQLIRGYRWLLGNASAR